MGTYRGPRGVGVFLRARYPCSSASLASTDCPQVEMLCSEGCRVTPSMFVRPDPGHTKLVGLDRLRQSQGSGGGVGGLWLVVWSAGSVGKHPGRVRPGWALGFRLRGVERPGLRVWCFVKGAALDEFASPLRETGPSSRPTQRPRSCSCKRDGAGRAVLGAQEKAPRKRP